MTELKSSVYLSGERVANQAAGIEAFMNASPQSILRLVLHEVAAGRMTPAKAAEALGCDLTAERRSAPHD